MYSWDRVPLFYCNTDCLRSFGSRDFQLVPISIDDVPMCQPGKVLFLLVLGLFCWDVLYKLQCTVTEEGLEKQEWETVNYSVICHRFMMETTHLPPWLIFIHDSCMRRGGDKCNKIMMASDNIFFFRLFFHFKLRLFILTECIKNENRSRNGK